MWRRSLAQNTTGTEENTLLLHTLLAGLICLAAGNETTSSHEANRILPVESWPSTLKANTWIYDFGKPVVGRAGFRVHGNDGQSLLVRHGNRLTGNKHIQTSLNVDVATDEIVTLRDNESNVILSDLETFRYVEIRGAGTKPDVFAEVGHAPWPENAGQLSSSAANIDAIWSNAAKTVRMSTQEELLDPQTLDGPAPIRSLWSMAPTRILLTGDVNSAAKALTPLVRSIDAPASGENDNFHIEDLLLYPSLLNEYYMLTGDRDFVEPIADANIPNVFAYLEDHRVAGGLIRGSAGLRLMGDEASDEPSTIVCALHVMALESSAELFDGLFNDGGDYRQEAVRVRDAARELLWDSETGLFRDFAGSEDHSLEANAFAMAAGLMPENEYESITALIRERGNECDPFTEPFLIEGCYRIGEPGLAFALLNADDESSLRAVSLITHEIAGLTPLEPGWTRVRFAPKLPSGIDTFDLAMHIPRGRMRIVYNRDSGYTVTAPPGIVFDTEAPQGEALEIFGDMEMARRPLYEHDRDLLNRYGWNDRVGDARGVWVSVGEQMYRIIEGGDVVWEVRCATAAAGIGSQSGSLKTPLGWHNIFRKLGDDAPWGQVFRARQPTNEIWEPGGDTKEDLVLTRVLLLDGEEPGQNKGGNVDSRARYIYVHGTNDEERIGQPSSHGCIRLRNDDVITAYNLVGTDTPLLITEE